MCGSGCASINQLGGWSAVCLSRLDQIAHLCLHLGRCRRWLWVLLFPNRVAHDATVGAYWLNLSRSLAFCPQHTVDLQTSRGRQANSAFQLSFTCGANGLDWLARGKNKATIAATIAGSISGGWLIDIVTESAVLSCDGRFGVGQK